MNTTSNEKIESEITMMDRKISEKTGTHIVYALVECPKCGNRWGINPDEDGKVMIHKFLCKNCFAVEMLNGTQK